MAIGAAERANGLLRQGPVVWALVVLLAFCCGAVTSSALRHGSAAARPCAVRSGVLNWDGCDLRRVSFAGVDLREASLRGATLDGVDLDGRDLTGADLRGASLVGVTLSGARLIGANLSGVDARAAVLTGACLRGADLERADLEDAELTRADLAGADRRGTLTAGARGLARTGRPAAPASAGCRAGK